jgi:endonuclease/exonuclease/phosphatase (EEP) superfamily protein YafD
MLVLGYQMRTMFPFTRIAAKQVPSSSRQESDSTFSLLVANVLMSNRETVRLLKMIGDTDPDIILLLESDDWWETQMRVLETSHRHTLKKPLSTRHGMLLYSRFPLVDSKFKFLVDDEIPSIHTKFLLPSGKRVWLHGLHPDPPSPTESDKSTARDVELLIVGEAVKDRDEPTIVAGDLNDVAWSYTTTLFQKVSGLLDPRRGRGFFNTFNAKNVLIRWPLDHVFHSDHFALVEMKRMSAFGSDHFPVYVKLDLQPELQSEQEGPELDHEDAERVEEKMSRLRDQTASS